MRSLPTFFLFPALLLASCATSSKISAPITPEAMFERADADGDGLVSREEALNMMVADAFTLFDADGDEAVTEEEFLASGGTSDGFHTVNQSGSGQISLEEAQASPAVFNTFAVSFDEADTDQDGNVTLAEYIDYLKQRDAATR